jgi:hypothetical protein
VVGVTPYDPEVTVVTRADGPGSLPKGRWEWAFIMAGDRVDLPSTLSALRDAVGPAGRVVLVGPSRLDLVAAAGAGTDLRSRRTRRRQLLVLGGHR